jgi:hypothetical protein
MLDLESELLNLDVFFMTLVFPKFGDMLAGQQHPCRTSTASRAA